MINTKKYRFLLYMLNYITSNQTAYTLTDTFLCALVIFNGQDEI